jgi:hypothetical protein
MGIVVVFLAIVALLSIGFARFLAFARLKTHALVRAAVNTGLPFLLLALGGLLYLGCCLSIS